MLGKPMIQAILCLGCTQAIAYATEYNVLAIFICKSDFHC